MGQGYKFSKPLPLVYIFQQGSTSPDSTPSLRPSVQEPELMAKTTTVAKPNFTGQFDKGSLPRSRPWLVKISENSIIPMYLCHQYLRKLLFTVHHRNENR